jgi:hypothetical protein
MRTEENRTEQGARVQATFEPHLGHRHGNKQPLKT